MGQYNKQGMYNGYKKNSKEREALDYYSTPPEEVYNILNTLDYDLSGKSILEPCCGGGHMIAGIQKYLDEKNQTPSELKGSDFQDRDFRSTKWELTYGLDFLADDYPIDKADVVVMNPPYATLEPFLIRALEIAQDKLIVLARTQALEGSGRWENVYKDNPPTAIYQYVDRIQCWKGGIEPKGTGSQAYAWLVWDKKDTFGSTKFNWLWSNKKYNN